jgi:hypothetical protein
MAHLPKKYENCRGMEEFNMCKQHEPGHTGTQMKLCGQHTSRETIPTPKLQNNTETASTFLHISLFTSV